MMTFRQFIAHNDNQYKQTIKGKSDIPNTGTQKPKFARKSAEIQALPRGKTIADYLHRESA